MAPVPVHAESTTADQSYFFSDLNSYFTAPSRWDREDWIKFGVITGSVVLISEKLDDHWKAEMTGKDHPVYYNKIADLGTAWGDLRLSGPFMLGVYGYGEWSHNDKYIYASHDMLQSVVYTGLMTQVLKEVFRRDRPNTAADEAGWFSHGSSFPSGHTSVAFAVSRSFLNSLNDPSLTTQILFYGLATTTAFARTYDNYHWLSDVVAGAALGIYTADFVTAQNKKHREQYTFVPYLGNRTLGFYMNW